MNDKPSNPEMEMSDIPSCHHTPSSTLLTSTALATPLSPSYVNSSPLKPAHLKKVTTMLKALADSNRLQLLLLLQQCSEPLCVSEIAEQTDEKITTVSNRLKQLYDAGLINKQRDGQHILYMLQDEHVEALLSNLVAHASH